MKIAVFLSLVLCAFNVYAADKVTEVSYGRAQDATSDELLYAFWKR